MRHLLLALWCIPTLPDSANATQWQSYKKNSTTQVEYLRDNDGLLHIRTQTTVNSGIGAVLYLLEDTANITNWLTHSQKAQLLSQPDSHTHIVHTFFNAIWPVSKRDMITKSVWQQNPQSLSLSMTITDMGQHFAPVKGYVRMQQVQGEWTITPQPDALLRIVYQGHADPAGKLPDFIADKVALKASWQTFNALNQVLASYQKLYPGILEPR